ncbi:type II toxin-antitoxin system HigB family toxin [Thiomicrospira microaerophila]|uniref:type II toxin-antitoxin system HigB family toxin n=1 Tax=Thiomicrospira microaerophila TaxID=406020 RepID=UPI00200BD74B|nr:type II toxin-antitoxin system HigB family toxin [Thiomicrospira microaerophila]UQB41939.1 type II toxin-antitoxin system HigB family toxin [Thiomicrospira microaerophila]
MRIISRATLRAFWEMPDYSDAEQALKAWYDEAKHASWLTPQDIKNQFRSASFVGNNRVVFNIHGNKYRLVVAINYSLSVCYVRFVGTHKQYDKIDVATI